MRPRHAPTFTKQTMQEATKQTMQEATKNMSEQINNFEVINYWFMSNRDTRVCTNCGHAKDLHKFSTITHDYSECTSVTTKQLEDDVFIDIDAPCDCKKYSN